MNLHKRFYIAAFLIFTGLLSTQVYADGIASVNSYVEIKSSATDFRARKESTNGQRSTSGFDFIITPERTDICQQGQSSSICTNTYNLVVLAMFQLEVRPQLYLGTRQPIHT